jgi:hypothetical protein
MSLYRTIALFLALTGSAFAGAFADFNTAIATFNSDVNSWNSGPLGLVAFNNDISTFDTAVTAFNTATSQSYATVLQVSPYGSVSPYEGSSAAITTFDTAVITFNTAVGNFDSGSLDRPDFASAVASFDIAAVNFNVAGASPPVSQELLPPPYSLEPMVTDPGPAAPEPSSAWLMIPGLVLAGVRIAKTRRVSVSISS